MMPTENATVAVFENPSAVEAAVEELREAGYDLRRLSVATRDPGVEEGAACYYKAGEEVRYWGRMGGFWNRLLDQLSGWAFLPIPGVGPVVVAGPLSEWIVAALENAPMFPGLTPMGAGLYSIGIPRDAINDYESALAAGNCLVILHGPAGEVAKAKRLLRRTMAATRIGAQ